MNYHNLLHREIDAGEFVVITEQNKSFNSGKTWVTKISATILTGGEKPFTGTRRENGPSWSSGNEVHSGQYIQYCSKWDGKRFRSMKNK